MRILSSLSGRREIRQVFFVAMEIAWIATLLDFLDSVIAGPARPATAWSLWLYPATYLYARLEQTARTRPLPRLALRVAAGGAAGLATLGGIAWAVLPHITAPTGENWVLVLAATTKIGIGPVVLAAVGCAVAIARGWLLGPRRINGDGFLAAFQAGIIVLFAVAFLRHLAGLPAGSAIVGTTLFLAFGLYGLWLSRWLDSDMAPRAVGRAGWPVLAAMIVGLVLAAGILFGNGLDKPAIDWLLTPVFWLLQVLGRILRFLLDLLPHWEAGRLPAFAPPKPTVPTVHHEPFRFGEISHAVGAVMFTIAMVGLIAMVIVRSLGDLLRWLSGLGPRTPGIDYDQSTFGFLDDLRAAIAALKAAFARLMARLGRLLHPGRAQPPAGVRAVRDVYGRLLKWGSRHGWPRPAGQTPYEYLDFLRTTAPHLETDLAVITDTYVAVRYGAAIPSADQIAAVRNGWRQIRRRRK